MANSKPLIVPLLKSIVTINRNKLQWYSEVKTLHSRWSAHGVLRPNYGGPDLRERRK